MAIKEAIESSVDKDIVEVNGNIFQVGLKKDGSYAVSQMREDGKLVGIKDEGKRSKAIKKFKSEKTKKEKKAIRNAEKLIKDFKAEEDAKIAVETERVEAVMKQVENARKALGKVGEDVEIVYHETDESYRKATGEESRYQSTNGEYNPTTNKVIHINGTKAKKNTVAHEVFHALLLRTGITNEQAKAITDRMLKAVKKTASPELLQKIKDHADKYILLDKNNKAVLDNKGNTIPSPLQSEESIAELFGLLASEYQQMDAPTQSIVKLWLDKIAKLLGLKPFTDAEVIDLLNVVSAKVEAGQEITEQDVKILDKNKSKISDANKRFQNSFSDRVSGMTYMYDVATDAFKKIDEKYITRDKSISDFNGMFMILHQPDAAFSGQIKKGDELLVQGKGGIFYPIKFHEKGYFWASTSKAAKDMAQAMNDSMNDNKGNKGKIYLALTTAPIDKVLSSTNAANGVMDLFISLSRDSKLKINNIRSILIDAYNTASFKKEVEIDGKIVIQKDNIDAEIKIDEVITKIKKKLAPDKSVFDERKKFSKAIIGLVVESMGDSKTNQEAHNRMASIFGEGMMAEDLVSKFKSGSKVSKAGLVRAVSQMLSEPILRDVDSKNGSIYAVLEIKGEVEAVDAKSKDDHESYPKAIKSKGKSKTTLHLLTDRVQWQDVTIDPNTEDTVNKSEKVLSNDPKKAKKGTLVERWTQINESKCRGNDKSCKD